MKLTKTRLKQIIKEEIDSLSHDDALGVTEPRYDTPSTPEDRLLRSLFMRQKLDGMSEQEMEQLADGDEEVMSLIRRLLDDQMLDNPRM